MALINLEVLNLPSLLGTNHICFWVIRLDMRALKWFTKSSAHYFTYIHIKERFVTPTSCWVFTLFGENGQISFKHLFEKIISQQ